jgi:predicted anti-sigma-YlaC factor YlaD
MKEDQVGAVIPLLFTVAIAFTIAIGVILSCDAVALIGLTAFVWAAVFLRIKEELNEDQVGAVILLLFTVAIAFTIAVGVILS